MMSDNQTFEEKRNQHLYYEIRLKGHLDTRWVDWFEGMTITLEEGGDTLLTGPVNDQAALHGLLKKYVIWACRWSRSVLFDKTHPYRSKKEIKNECD